MLVVHTFWNAFWPTSFERRRRRRETGKISRTCESRNVESGNVKLFRAGETLEALVGRAGKNLISCKVLERNAQKGAQ